jgi:isopenicillin-N N-acyltransferase-like protein
VALPIVSLEGPPFDQGWRHGVALADQIEHNLRVYYNRFQREAQLSPDEARDRASRYLPVLEGHAYLDGLQGLARGAGQRLIDVLVLNVRYELLYYQYGVCGIGGRPDGCTAFALLPEASANRHLLLGQNWDWIPDVKGAVLHTREPDDLLETVGFTEAGILGAKIGLNSTGLGLAINGLLTSEDDWSQVALPFHARCYEVLRATSLAAAAAAIKHGRRPCSANFLLAQVPDQALDLEAAPARVREVLPQSQAVVHANHFLDPEAMGIEEPVVERRPHTYWRQDRLRALLEARMPVSTGDMEVVLRDHDRYPDSVCRHENLEDPPEEWCITVTSAMMDLVDRRLWLTDGPPCEHLYEGFSLSHTAALGS